MPKRVLVVDDDEMVRSLFNDLLKREKCIVQCVGTAEDGLDKIEKESFDVVLLDIKLPGMSGLEALKRIKIVKPNLTVVMITGFGFDEELLAKSKEYGCSGYIGKNLPTSEIMNSFRAYLASAVESRKDN
jgi:CheY-like chemotaxis protein